LLNLFLYCEKQRNENTTKESNQFRKRTSNQFISLLKKEKEEQSPFLCLIYKYDIFVTNNNVDHIDIIYK